MPERVGMWVGMTVAVRADHSVVKKVDLLAAPRAGP